MLNIQRFFCLKLSTYIISFKAEFGSSSSDFFPPPYLHLFVMEQLERSQEFILRG